jgi:hypothetical protein
MAEAAHVSHIHEPRLRPNCLGMTTTDMLVDDGLVTTRIERFDLHPDLRAARTTEIVLPFAQNEVTPQGEGTELPDDLDCLCDDPELTMQLRAAHQGRKLILMSLAGSLLAIAGGISLVMS